MEEKQMFSMSELNPLCLWRRLWKNWLLILAAGLIALMGTEIAVQNLYAPEYTAGAVLAVSVKRSSYSTVLSNLSMSAEIADTFTQLFESNMFGSVAAGQLGVESLPGTLKATVLPETNLLSLRVTADSPEDAFQTLKLMLENYDTVDLNGDGVISYVMFKGQEGNAEAEARTQFGVEDANAVLTAAGKPELAYYNASATDKYLVDQGGKWSAQAANDYMATILPEYSEANGNMVELIICNNDGMAEGAVSALQGAGYNTGDGKTIPVFGVDATDSAKQLINEGKMTGTIKQDAEGMASTILNLVSSVQGGGELMDNTSSFNVDEGVAKIRVPYATYTGE